MKIENKIDESFYMNVEMVSKYLHVAESTVYRWVGMNFIPHAKLGTKNVFIKEQIDTWVKQNIVTQTKLPELPTFSNN
jgi:excisionase family DNA binding protein